MDHLKALSQILRNVTQRNLNLWYDLLYDSPNRIQQLNVTLWKIIYSCNKVKNFKENYILTKKLLEIKKWNSLPNEYNLSIYVFLW